MSSNSFDQYHRNLWYFSQSPTLRGFGLFLSTSGGPRGLYAIPEKLLAFHFLTFYKKQIKKLVYLLNLWAVWKDCETKWWQITRTKLLEENPLVIPAQMHNHIQFQHLHTFHSYVYMCEVDENVNVCIVHTKGCVQKKSPHPRKQLFISDTPTTITSGRREPLWESHIDKHQGKRRLSSLLCGPHLCIFIKAFQMFSDKNIKKLINAAFFASSLPCYLVIICFEF